MKFWTETFRKVRTRYCSQHEGLCYLEGTLHQTEKCSSLILDELILIPEKYQVVYLETIKLRAVIYNFPRVNLKMR